MLVEVLPRAQAQQQAAVAEHTDCRCLLCDHSRVVAHDRAGDVGHEIDTFGRVRDSVENGPGIGRMSLAVEPREVVITDHFEVEAGDLGANGVAHEIARIRLFAHQGVSDSDHACGVPERVGRLPVR